MSGFSRSGWDRVARTRLNVIPEGDGALSTHTNPTPAPHRKVTTQPDSSPPLPVGAINLPAIPVVAVMALVVVTLGATALRTVFPDNPARTTALVVYGVVLALDVAVVAGPVVVRWWRR